jgi:hypothetical protein
MFNESEVNAMNISEKLTQQQIQEILFHVYKKGQESENIKARDLIQEIKQHILSVSSFEERSRFNRGEFIGSQG